MRLFPDQIVERRKWVEKAMSEFRSIGHNAFLTKYSKETPPKWVYLVYDGVAYPAKALWAGALSHGVSPTTRRGFSYTEGRSELKRLGFTDFTEKPAHDVVDEIDTDLDQMESEGERRVAEIGILKRSSAIVAAAKKRSPLKCEVCDFDFEQTYGELGRGYIECHHIEPLNARGGTSALTRVGDLALLCANCHRMVHRKGQVVAVEDLRKHLCK